MEECIIASGENRSTANHSGQICNNIQKEKSRIPRLVLTNGKYITAETVNLFLKGGIVTHSDTRDTLLLSGFGFLPVALLPLGSLARKDYRLLQTA